MKKRLLFALFFAFILSINVNAQSSDKKVYYRYSHVSFDTKRGMYVIYLQEGGSEDDPIPMTDDNGNMLKFPTWIDAMNYLSLQGWEVVTHQAGEEIYKMWILKKEVSQEELKELVKDNMRISQRR
jgi:hypothetical protein